MTKAEFDKTGYKVGDNVLITYDGNKMRITITDILDLDDAAALVTTDAGHTAKFPLSRISEITT